MATSRRNVEARKNCVLDPMLQTGEDASMKLERRLIRPRRYVAPVNDTP